MQCYGIGGDNEDLRNLITTTVDAMRREEPSRLDQVPEWKTFTNVYIFYIPKIYLTTIYFDIFPKMVPSLAEKVTALLIQTLRRMWRISQ